MPIRNLSNSQNFLRNPDIARSLLDQSDINPNDLVVEIGPGKGVITKELAKRSRKVIAIEQDRRLVSNLRASFFGIKNIDLVGADFLEWNLPKEQYKVFSNIPFDLTADIVRKLTQRENAPKSTYLFMQDKALYRFSGKPLANETQSSLLIKPWFKVEITTRIGRKSFQPIPNVDIVLAHIYKLDTPELTIDKWQEYRDFVIFGFNQWKPTLAEALRSVFSPKQLVIIKKHSNIDQKPSDVPFEDWLKVFDSYVDYVSPEKKQKVRGSENKLAAQQAKLKKIHRTR